MKYKFLPIFLFALNLCAAKEEEKAVPVLPGVELAGQAFSLLQGYLSSSQMYSILTYEYKTGQTTPDRKYLLPDGFSYSPFPNCSQDGDTFGADTYEEFIEKMNSKFGVGGKYKKFTGAYSNTYAQVKEKIGGQNNHLTHNSMSCTQYVLNLLPGQTPLAPWFKNELAALPSEFNQANETAFFDFFNQYGDAVVISCHVGGTLLQRTYTKQDFAKQKGREEVERAAKASFFLEIDGKTSSETKVSSDFKDNSEITRVTSIGGMWPKKKGDWDDWVRSIQNLENLACANASTVPLYKFLKNYPEYAPLSQALRTAMAAFYAKEGCTDISASNYDAKALVDNGSCIYQSAEPCVHLEVSADEPAQAMKKLGHFGEHENLWLVEGPDAQKECAISFAYTTVDYNEKSLIQGQAGTVQSANQNLIVMRSDSIKTANPFGPGYCHVSALDSLGGKVTARSHFHEQYASKATEYAPGQEISVAVQLSAGNFGRHIAGLAVLMEARK